MHKIMCFFNYPLPLNQLVNSEMISWSSCVSLNDVYFKSLEIYLPCLVSGMEGLSPLNRLVYFSAALEIMCAAL